jgi:hypothetical protein
MATTGINQPHAITGGVAEAFVGHQRGEGDAHYFVALAERTLDEIETQGTRLELILAHAREVPAP